MVERQVENDTATHSSAMSRTFITKYENTWPRAGARNSDAAHTKLQEHSLTVTPILTTGSSDFGAEIDGIDWSQSIPPEIVKQVSSLFLRSLGSTLTNGVQLVRLSEKYAVLIFRKTGLDNAGHIAFSQQLGEKLETNPFYHGRENDRVGEPLLWDVGK